MLHKQVISEYTALMNHCIHCEEDPKMKAFDNGLTKGFYVHCGGNNCDIKGATRIVPTEKEAVDKWNAYYGNKDLTKRA